MFFDWSWADAYYQHGIEYYPKYVTSVPFTPSVGPRICIAPLEDEQDVLTKIISCLQQQANSSGASSWHVLFPEKKLSDQLADLGMLQRTGCQYQWFNKNYADFESFLQSFSSRKRKNLKKSAKKFRKIIFSLNGLMVMKLRQNNGNLFIDFIKTPIW